MLTFDFTTNYRQLKFVKMKNNFNELWIGQYVYELSRYVWTYKTNDIILQTRNSEGIIVSFLQCKSGFNDIYAELNNGDYINLHWLTHNANLRKTPIKLLDTYKIYPYGSASHLTKKKYLK